MVMLLRLTDLFDLLLPIIFKGISFIKFIKRIFFVKLKVISIKKGFLIEAD